MDSPKKVITTTYVSPEVIELKDEVPMEFKYLGVCGDPNCGCASIVHDDQSPMKGDPRFKQLLDDMWDMHCRKGNDYGRKAIADGSGEDFLANLRASETYGVPAWIGALIRGNDKMIRLENAAKGVTLANESVEDSLMDLACYALLSLILYREGISDNS